MKHAAVARSKVCGISVVHEYRKQTDTKQWLVAQVAPRCVARLDSNDRIDHS